MDTIALANLAEQILDYAKDSLRLSLRFMDRALHKLETKEMPQETFAIVGDSLVYSPQWIIRRYKDRPGKVSWAYLHAILHCVFLHMYVAPTINRQLWNLACDIAVESVIVDMDLAALRIPGIEQKKKRLSFLSGNVKSLTAEHIYAWFRKAGMDADQLQEWQGIFGMDDHSHWYPEEEKETDGEGNGESSGKEKPSPGQAGKADGKEEWERIAEMMLTDLETFSKDRGNEAGELVQNLEDITREKYSYTEFLKKFATREEIMKLDMEEFDNVFYTYGLRLYGNVPLIEPLEYREDKRIRELVIAIDTSGSVSGDLVNGFMRKTFNILKSVESFAKRFVLYLIQCDAEIQETKRIETQEEFDAYLKEMTLKGFGGTDFRPVFDYVDQLIENKELCNLKGLIYFTDGCGVFPVKKPAYETVFVFLEDEDVFVPPWAIKLLLDEKELE